MINFVRIFGLAALLSVTYAARAVPVEIRVKNVTEARGPILISLFTSAASWASEKPDTVLKLSKVTVGTSKLLVDLPAGTYAFFLFQDLDGNGQLLTSGFGFPAEPYAFSNDVQISFSKPAWNDIKFVVPKAGKLTAVTLNHP